MSTDMLTLKQAAVQSGKSVSTLRSWIRAGKLTADKGTLPNAPVMVSKSDLLSAMQAAGMLDAADSPSPVNRQPDVIERLLDSVTGERDRLLADLASDRAYYRAEIAKLQAAVESERQRRADLEQHIAALQRELSAAGSHGRGVWGYLTDGVKRITGGK